MIPEMVVAGMLMDTGIKDVFVGRPSVMACAEPVTVEPAECVGEERFADGLRGGGYRVGVVVCRETARASCEAALACERALRCGSWEPYGDERVVCVTAAAPRALGRDGSGCWLYEVRATIGEDVSQSRY